MAIACITCYIDLYAPSDKANFALHLVGTGTLQKNETQWCTRIKTAPCQAALCGLVSTPVLSLFKTVLILIRTKTENGLKPEQNVMHAISSTYTLLVRCERPLGSVPTPPKGTQHEQENIRMHPIKN